MRCTAIVLPWPEKLDYSFSKGKLSIELDASEPHINLDRRIVLDEARHPLMDPQISVPLTFELGTNNVVVTYAEKTADIPVTVAEKAISGIEVYTAPTKVSYIEGQSFDPTGLVIRVNYNNSTSENVKNIKFCNYSNTAAVFIQK